jgi:hypothetical protein
MAEAPARSAEVPVTAPVESAATSRTNTPQTPARTEAPAAPTPTAHAEAEFPASQIKLPVRDIAIRVVDDNARSADVRVSERGGEVKVAVRTADPAVATSLRSDLSDLVQRIERRDVAAEVWHPGERTAAPEKSELRGDSEGGRSSSQQQGGQAFDQSRGQHSGRGTPHAPEWLDELDDQTLPQHKKGTR